MQTKTYFGRIFQKFCANQAYPLPKFVKFRHTFCNFYSGSVSRWKKFSQVLSYVVCTQVRIHVHKQITKTRYGEEKPGRFVFEKSVLITLGLGLTTPYSSGVLVWNFYQTFGTVSIEFLAGTWGPDSSHKFGNKIFIHHCQGWKESSFVCETVWFLSWVNTHPFDLKFVVCCSKFSRDS